MKLEMYLVTSTIAGVHTREQMRNVVNINTLNS